MVSWNPGRRLRQPRRRWMGGPAAGYAMTSGSTTASTSSISFA